jgi:hypothetical protein
MKRLTIAAGVTVAAVMTAAAAAHPLQTAIVTKVENLEFGATIPDCFPGAGITFDLASPAGANIGEGTGCITGSSSNCPDGPVPGCHETTYSTLTFTFEGRGTVVAPSTFRQTDLPNGLAFRSTGDITSGTGEFAAATGTLSGQGVISSDLETNATYVVKVP